jgi:hypothetical protein
MARPIYYAIAPVAADTSGWLASQTRSSAGALIINGTAAGTVLDFARLLSITSTSNLSGLTFTFTGTDAQGRALTETVTGPNNTTVNSVNYFQTVTAATVSATMSTNNVNVGYTGSLATPLIKINHLSRVAAEIAVELQAGTATFSVQETYSKSAGEAGITEIWFTPSTFSAKSASTLGQIDLHAKAVRLTTSAISAPTLSLNIFQNIRD